MKMFTYMTYFEVKTHNHCIYIDICLCNIPLRVILGIYTGVKTTRQVAQDVVMKLAKTLDGHNNGIQCSIEYRDWRSNYINGNLVDILKEININLNINNSHKLYAQLR